MLLDAAQIVGPLLLAALINLTAAAVTTGSPMRRAFGVFLGVLSMGPPWLVPPEHCLVRSVWVIAAFAGTIRTVDLARGSWSLRDRLTHVVSVVDTRRLRHERPWLDGAALAQFFAWQFLAWPAYYAIPLASRFSGASYWLWRWFFALVFLYTLSAGAYPLLFFAYRALGFVTPALHIAPAAARSVQEFWGERWNRTIGVWLNETFFRPLARKRRPALGGFAAFTASAIVHAYIEWVAVTWTMALVMLAFFLSQAVVIGMERVLRVRAWRPIAGHAWTIAWMVGLSPLFSEPGLRAFGM